MRRKIFDMFMDNEGVSDIIRSSSKAVCGAFEREIIVKNSQVSSVKNRLRKEGYVILGTGEAGFGRTKIWFNPAGVSL